MIPSARLSPQREKEPARREPAEETAVEMNFDLRLRSASSRILLGASSLLAFTFFAFHVENTFFADFLDKIPLFGTEFAVVSQPLDPQYQFRLGMHWLVANQPELAVPPLERATSLNP